MGVKEIPLRKWLKFLKSQGLVKVRINGGHEIWNHPVNKLGRPITFSNHGNSNNIPVSLIDTNLKTLEISKAEFEQIIEMREMCHVSEIRTTDNTPTFKITYKNEHGLIEFECFRAHNKTQARNEFYEYFSYKLHPIDIEDVSNSEDMASIP